MGIKMDSNPTIVIHFNSAGDVVKLDMIVAGQTMSKTIQQDDPVSATTKTISSWT